MTREYVRRPISRGWPWYGVAVGAGVAIAVQVGALTAAVGVQPATLGGVVVGAALYAGVIAYGVYRHDPEPAGLTPATVVTILRGTPVVVLAGFLVGGRPEGLVSWAPALLFGAAAVLDAADGRIARTTDTVSALGGWLDIETDAFAVAVAVVVAVQIGAVPAVFLLVGVMRYVFVGAILLREARGRPTAPLDAWSFRRISGAIQMGVLFVVLAPVLPAVGTGLAIVWVVVVVVSFTRDWLVVTHRRPSAA